MMDLSQEIPRSSHGGAHLNAIANELPNYLLSFWRQQPLDRQTLRMN